MNELQKVMKSRTLREAVCNIPDSFFNSISFVLAFIFMVNPLLVFLNSRYLLFLPDCMDTINGSTLLVGTISALLFLVRRILTSREFDAKAFAKENLPIVIFLVFAVLMTIATIANGGLHIMLHGSSYRKEGLFGYLGYVVYFIIIAINNSDKKKTIWLYAFVSTSAVLELVTIYEHYALGTYDYSFVFSQYNHYGYYLLMSAAVSTMLIITSPHKWQKAVFSLSFLIAFLALIINDTFGCQIAVLVGIVFVCIMYSVAKSKFRPVTLVPMALFILTLVFAGATSENLHSKINSNFLQIQNDTNALANGTENAEFSTGVSRIVLWENGLQYISEEPLKGHGADATSERMLEDSNQDNDRCHCEYMNYAISFGIPAALAYIAAVAAVYFRGLKHRKKLTETQLIGLGAAMFYLVSAVIGNSMYYTAPYLFILLGMGYFREQNEALTKQSAE